MKLSDHADRTEKIVGIRAEDIHEWIDGMFDVEGFDHFLRVGNHSGFDPYDHRKQRHSYESLEDAYKLFKGKYTKKQIKAVFECHVKDDYDGYLPHLEDFERAEFKEKYHEKEEQLEKEKILSKQELSEYFKGKEYLKKDVFSKKRKERFLLRIVIPTVLAIVLFVLSIFIIIVPVFRNNMLDSKKEMIKELTNAAASIVFYYIELEKKKILPRKVAQKKAAIEIKKMRYGEDHKDYFWITDMHPKMIMHPYRTELDGKDLTNYKDSEDKSGKKLFVEFVDLIKEKKEGYLEYLWQWKNDQLRTAPKLSYVQGIKEWNWIVGTGIYILDVEEEINRLTRVLLIIFGNISLIITIILLYVVWQSNRIENNRVKAETGLKEAKDRYRALVEASNEGYILEVAGENIYSNHTLQRMLGYNEEQLSKLKLWDLLDSNSSINSFAIAHFKKLIKGQSKSAEFEAQVKTKSKEIIDVIVTTSKIFFSKKNGHVISFRKIIHKKAENLFTFYNVSRLNTANQFFTKKVKDIFRPLKKEKFSQKNKKIIINNNAPIIDALTLLQSLKKDYLIVEDKNKNIIGSIGYSEIAKMIAALPADIILEIKKSKTLGHVVNMLNRLPLLIREMATEGATAETMRATIGKVFDTAITQIIEISIKELGKPPVKFAFISLGSNARHEMTMFSDQDNALVFEDVKEDEFKRVQRYFLKLAEAVCSKLNQAGYPYCPGGIMASNNKWCLSVSQWKKYFDSCILNATPKSILDVNVFIDMFATYGTKELVEDLQKYIFKITDENPEFYLHFARNCLLYKAPLNLLGRIKAEKKAGVKTINIKESLKPIEIFSRIYSLKNKISVPSTIDRLQQLNKIEVLQKSTFKEMIYVFDYLWNLRFYNQIVSHADLKRVSDELDLEELTELELKNLRNILSNISVFQSKLSYDFLGNALL